MDRNVGDLGQVRVVQIRIDPKKVIKIKIYSICCDIIMKMKDIIVIV